MQHVCIIKWRIGGDCDETVINHFGRRSEVLFEDLRVLLEVLESILKISHILFVDPDAALYQLALDATFS
jgi:hypothetical protein